MKALLTNDDGVDAPGLQMLHELANQLGIPTVVAPHTALSGCSHQVTTDRPLTVRECTSSRYAVDGTSSDCVRLGLMHLAPDVDWVLSGINDGGNLGVDVLMSGTVGAAREAALLGKKAIALSQYRRRDLPFEWSWARDLAASVLETILRRPLPPRCFWNVNLPVSYQGKGPLPDIVFCPLDPHPLPVRYEVRDGAFHYRSNYQARARRAGSDVDICFSGRITVTLLSVDSA
ncbi:MAG: 5'/3'-nucleotidase SurE [Pirellulaceae bacterium]